MNKYYTLLSRADDTAPWCIEFGSYDHADVMAERDEFGDKGHRISLLKIIKTGDHQSEIDAEVAKLNAELPPRRLKTIEELRRNLAEGKVRIIVRKGDAVLHDTHPERGS